MDGQGVALGIKFSDMPNGKMMMAQGSIIRFPRWSGNVITAASVVSCEQGKFNLPSLIIKHVASVRHFGMPGVIAKA